MSVGWRFLVVIYNLVIIALAGVIIAMSVGRPEPLQLLNLIVANAQNRIIAGLVAVLVLVIGLICLVAAFRRDPKSKEPKPVNQFLVDNSFDGEVYISVDAIRMLINKAVKKLDGTRDVESRIRPGEEGLIIDLTTRINAERSVPEITQGIQQVVKEDLEQLGGLKVSTINVLINESAPVAVK